MLAYWQVLPKLKKVLKGKKQVQKHKTSKTQLLTLISIPLELFLPDRETLESRRKLDLNQDMEDFLLLGGQLVMIFTIFSI